MEPGIALTIGTDPFGKGRRGDVHSPESKLDYVRHGGKAVSSFEVPPAVADAVPDHFMFDLSKVDHWYPDDDLGYAHPRDPYNLCDVRRASP